MDEDSIFKLFHCNPSTWSWSWCWCFWKLWSLMAIIMSVSFPVTLILLIKQFLLLLLLLLLCLFCFLYISLSFFKSLHPCSPFFFSSFSLSSYPVSLKSDGWNHKNVFSTAMLYERYGSTYKLIWPLKFLSLRNTNIKIHSNQTVDILYFCNFIYYF